MPLGKECIIVLLLKMLPWIPTHKYGRICVRISSNKYPATRKYILRN